MASRPQLQNFMYDDRDGNATQQSRSVLRNMAQESSLTRPENDIRDAFTKQLAKEAFVSAVKNDGNLDLSTRQKVFEDIIIQRIKVIQAYVKKQLSKLKNQVGGQMGNNQPVILNSIHNDGMALDLKIKDIVRQKMEAVEAKGRLKEERLLTLELAQSKHDEALAETMNLLQSGAETELLACK